RRRPLRRRPEASAFLTSGDVIKAAMKKKENVVALARRGPARPPPGIHGNGNDSSNGASSNSVRAPVTTELEAAIRRYVDLYDFAPIGYVSFSRDGRIEEINLTATELL